jgi:hypothetical protein
MMWQMHVPVAGEDASTIAVQITAGLPVGRLLGSALGAKLSDCEKG